MSRGAAWRRWHGLHAGRWATRAGSLRWQRAAPTVSRSFTVLPATLALSTGAAGTTKVGVAFSQANTATGAITVT
mgnify:CR=1 FL=1